MGNKEWKKQKYKEDYNLCVAEFKKYYNMFGDLIKYCPYDRLCIIFRNARSRVDNGVFIERYTFKQFIKSLGLKAYKCFD